MEENKLGVAMLLSGIAAILTYDIYYEVLILSP